MNGSITSSVTVTSPGILGGTGTITGNVSGTGTVAPGTSPGVLTINGNFTPGGTVELEAASPYTTAGTHFDRIVVNGAVNLSAATLSFIGAGGAGHARASRYLHRQRRGRRHHGGQQPRPMARP